MNKRRAMLLGLLLGTVFGIWDLIATQLDPLADDSPMALLQFYGPMFAAWGIAGFVTSRHTGRRIEGMKIGALVAFATFVVFDLAVIVRVNLYLQALTGRADWQNLMERFRASGVDSLRAFLNYAYVTGAPIKILVAAGIGALFGLVGGIFGRLGRSAKQAARA